MLNAKDHCSCKKKKCTEMFTDEERNEYHTQYWKMNKTCQKMWLLNTVKETKSSRKVEGSRRNFSRLYLFQKADKQIHVCQKFFLFTLGYKSTSIIDHLLRKAKDEHGIPRLVPPEDGRGKHSPVNKKNRELIKSHIRSYNPKPSHYRREHAPKRLYLPSDLSIKAMHNAYVNINDKISYELYRQVLDSMNIGFYEAEADKCHTCIELELNPTEENLEKKEAHLKEVSVF